MRPIWVGKAEGEKSHPPRFDNELQNYEATGGDRVTRAAIYPKAEEEEIFHLQGKPTKKWFMHKSLRQEEEKQEEQLD